MENEDSASVADIKAFPASHTYDRNQAQNDLINAAAEVAYSFPELTGFVVLAYNADEEMCDWQIAEPMTERELPNYVRETLQFWINENDMDIS